MLRERPVRAQTKPGDIARRIEAAAPERGEPMEAIFADFERIIPDGLTHWQHPRFFAYFPANAAPVSVVADYLVTSIAAQCMLWQTSPAATELEIKVLAHPFFRRAGDDVVCSVPLTFTQVALGGEVEVPTLDGKGNLRVPAGTQPGTVLRIKGKGMPKRTGIGRGDQRIEVAVEIPNALTPRQREIIEELAKELGEEVTPIRKSFMEKLRDLFG